MAPRLPILLCLTAKAVREHEGLEEMDDRAAVGSKLAFWTKLKSTLRRKVGHIQIRNHPDCLHATAPWATATWTSALLSLSRSAG